MQIKNLILFLAFIGFICSQTIIVNTEEYNDCSAATIDSDKTTTKWSVVNQSDNQICGSCTSCYYTCEEVATTYKILHAQPAQKFVRQYTLDPHYNIKITLKAIMIDGWSAGEKINIVIDGTIVASATKGTSPINAAREICDLTATSDDEDHLIDTGAVTHTSNTIVIEIEGLSGAGGTPQFGITDFYFEINECDPSCLTCTAGTNNSCSSCYDNFYLNGTACSPCSTGCLKCDGGTSTDCLRCGSGVLKLDTSECLPAKPVGYYLDSSCTDPVNSSTVNCYKPCGGTNCNTCTSGSSTCIDCPNTYFLQPSPNLQCLTTCPDNYFENTANNQCSACTNNCLTCNANSSDCTDCPSGYALYSSTCIVDSTCPERYFFEIVSGPPNRICSQCETTTGDCLKCISASLTDCQRCDSGTSSKMLFNIASASIGRCYSSCPVGTYSSTCVDPLDSSSIDCCKRCDAACATKSCTGPLPTDCTGATCESGWAMVTGHGCQVACNPVQSTCLSCEADQTTCNFCASNKFLHQGACIASPCPNEYYDDTTNRVCGSCNSKCATCLNSASNCLSCKAGYALNGSSCINDTDCPVNTFFKSSNLECTSCAANCQVCLDETASNCKRCDSATSKMEMSVDLTKGTCQTSCQNGTYPTNCIDTIDGVTSIDCCLPCESSCLTCVNSSECATCPSTEYRQPITNLCAAGCPDNYFENSDFTCQPCTNNCYTCSANSSDCTNCVTGYALSGNNCVLQTACPDRTFFELVSGTPDQRLCSQCETTSTYCLKCTSNALTDCQRCDSSRILFNANSTTHGKCVTTCPAGTYENTCTDPLDSSTVNCCTPCHEACSTQTCTGNLVTECITCDATDWVLITGQGCHNTCSPTQATCASCLSDRTTCRYCVSSNFLLNGACSGSCPVKYYEDATNRICVACNTECAECTSGTVCTVCENNYSLYNNACISNTACPNRTFFNSANKQCLSCASNCLKCIDATATNCQRCDGASVIEMNVAHTSGECKSSCPVGTYQGSCTDIIDGVTSILCCLPCPTGCLDCTSALLSSCTVCDTANGYKIEAGPGCVRTCTSAPNCDTCYADRTTCRTCVASNFLDTVAGTCDTTCPSLYFKNNGVCSACFVGCTACVTTSTNCSTCANGYFLSGSTCLSSCPDGFYHNNTTNVCDACTNHCLECIGTAADECMRCDSINGYYIQFNTGQIIQGTCSNTKPSDAFIAIPSNQYCQDPIDSSDIYCYITCNPACTSCSGPLIEDCTSCTASYVFVDGQGCQFACTDPSLNCYTCFADDATCKNCDIGFYLYNGSCSASCPANSQTFENTALSTCDPCNIRCKTCTFSADNCQSCNSGFYLHINDQACYATCPIGSFPNETTKQCDLCHSTCESCTGPSNSECTSCYDSLPILYQSTCVNCASFTGLEDDPNSVGDCYDICGDGITVKFYGDNDLLEVTNFLTCDDGNIIDNDGCDPNCQVMDGWQCLGGTTTAEDICNDITPSSIYFEFMNFDKSYNNQDNINEPLIVQIKFSKKIYVNHPTKTLQDYFQINVVGLGDDMGQIISFKEIEGPGSDYVDTTTNLRFLRRNLAYPPVIEGPQYFEMQFIIKGNVVNREIEIMVVNGGDLLDYNGNSIAYGGEANPNKQKIPMYLYYSENERDNAIKGGYLISILVGVIQVGALLLIFTGRYFHAIGSVDSLQMVDLFQFLNIDWPLNAVDYFERISSNRLQGLFDNFIGDALDEGTRKSGDSFNKQGVDASFLQNMGQYLVIILILLFIFCLIKLLTNRILGKLCCVPFARNLARYKQSILEWGYLLDILNYMTLYFVTFGFLNYVSLKLDSIGGLIGFILSHVCWFLPVTLFVLGTRYILKKSVKLYPDFEIQNEQFWFEVYSGRIGKLNYTFRWRNLWYLLRFNKDQTQFNAKQYILLIFILRKIIFGISMVILSTQALFQLIIFSLCNVFIILFVLILRPFQRLRDNFKYVLCESILLIGQIALMLLQQQDNREQEKERKDYAWIMIFCSTGVICIHMIFMVNEGIWALMLMLYNKYKNRLKVRKQTMQVHNMNVNVKQYGNEVNDNQDTDEDQTGSDHDSDSSAIMPIKSDFRKQIFDDRDIIQFNNSEFQKYPEFKHIGQKPVQKQVLNEEEIKVQKKAYENKINSNKYGYNIEDEDEKYRKFTPLQESRNKVHKVVIKNTKFKY